MIYNCWRRCTVDEIEESASIHRLVEESLDLPPQVVVALAGFREKGPALATRRADAASNRFLTCCQRTRSITEYGEF